MREEEIDLFIDTLLSDVKTRDVYNKAQSVGNNILIHMNNNPHLFSSQGPVPMLLGLCEAFVNTVYNLVAQASPAYSTEKRDQAVITMAQEMLRTFIKYLEDFRAPEAREKIKSDYRERVARRKQQ